MNYMDSRLADIEIYKKYPAMTPFVGSEYSIGGILLLGESFYLPNDCAQNKSDHAWYDGNQSTIKDYEIPWIDCRGLILSQWRSPGHFLYRETDRCLKDAGMNNLDNAFGNVAFMNSFLRPSPKEGDSIKNYATSLDCDVALDTIVKVLGIIRPRIALFMSVFSFNVVGRRIHDKDVIIDHTCHPATGGRYWRKKSYNNGREKFLKIISDQFNLNPCKISAQQDDTPEPASPAR